MAPQRRQVRDDDHRLQPQGGRRQRRQRPVRPGRRVRQPQQMFTPGLVLEADEQDWGGFYAGQGLQLGDPGREFTAIAATDLNYPSIGISQQAGPQTVTSHVPGAAEGDVDHRGGPARLRRHDVGGRGASGTRAGGRRPRSTSRSPAPTPRWPPGRTGLHHPDRAHHGPHAGRAAPGVGRGTRRGQRLGGGRLGRRDRHRRLLRPARPGHAGPRQGRRPAAAPWPPARRRPRSPTCPPGPRSRASTSTPRTTPGTSTSSCTG